MIAIVLVIRLRDYFAIFLSLLLRNPVPIAPKNVAFDKIFCVCKNLREIKKTIFKTLRKETICIPLDGK